MTHTPLSRLITLSLAATLLFSCFVIPAFAGRERITSENNLFDKGDVEAEVELGRQMAARMLGLYKLSDDPKLTEYVNLVGTGLAMLGQRTELEYRVAVLETPLPNAFAAPGGFIFLTRGAIDAMEEEAELAAALAHEIAHIGNRDIVRELRISGKGEFGAAAISQLISGGSSSQRLLQELMQSGMEILLKRGYKVEDEFKADADALLMLLAAGYDPSALVRYLERLTALNGADEPASMVRTHPSLAERKAKLGQGLASAGPGALNAERFKTRVGAR